ncbi:MAG: hypothetical protein SPE49_08065 [Campylobacter sp.]|uniref:hypothetical protein n=1 Tax=Campylobacter sp. TaxID=205 RepID=UPI002A807358|nr:hypothetical protein [Campylobacter sp.]MCI7587042.1 hypothetical protein [Campylobacter sp.]MDY5115903.1 hypothetical protein [Campylobacter sp.]
MPFLLFIFILPAVLPCGATHLAQLFASHPLGMRFLLLKPCTAQCLTQKLLLAFVR